MQTEKPHNPTRNAEPSPQPVPIRPAILTRWLTATARIHPVGIEQLPAEGAILVVQRNRAALLSAVYHRCFHGREGAVYPTVADETAWQASAAQIAAGRDMLIPVPRDEHIASLKLNEALRLARAAGCLIFPVGLSTGAGKLSRGRIDLLPGTRIAVVVEAPFYVPGQPDHIPEGWANAIHHLMERAGRQAENILATRKRRRRPPGR